MQQEIRTNRSSRIIFFLGLILFVIQCFSFSSAASLQSQGGGKDTLKIEVLPVEITNIGQETESTLGKIRDIKSSLKPSKDELSIDTLMPNKLAEIEELLNQINDEELETMDFRRSENLRSDLSQNKIQLENWQNTLSEQLEDLEFEKRELADLITMWEKTLDVDREEELPEKVLSRIQSNLDSLKKLEKQLVARNNVLLDKNEDLTPAIVSLDDILSKLDNSQAKRRKLFTIDSPPLWQAYSLQSQDTIPFNQQLKDVVKANSKDFDVFINNFGGEIPYYLIFFVVLLSLFLYVKRNVKKWSDEKRERSMGGTQHFIDQPLSSAMLVTLLTTSLFFPGAPEKALDVFYLLLLIPVLTIIPGIIPSVKKRYFYLYGFVFVLTQVQDYFGDLILLERSLQFMVDLLSIFILFSLIREKKEIKSQGSQYQVGFSLFYHEDWVAVLYGERYLKFGWKYSAY